MENSVSNIHQATANGYSQVPFLSENRDEATSSEWLKNYATPLPSCSNNHVPIQAGYDEGIFSGLSDSSNGSPPMPSFMEFVNAERELALSIPSIHEDQHAGESTNGNMGCSAPWSAQSSWESFTSNSMSSYLCGDNEETMSSSTTAPIPKPLTLRVTELLHACHQQQKLELLEPFHSLAEDIESRRALELRRGHCDFEKTQEEYDREQHQLLDAVENEMQRTAAQNCASTTEMPTDITATASAFTSSAQYPGYTNNDSIQNDTMYDIADPSIQGTKAQHVQAAIPEVAPQQNLHEQDPTDESTYDDFPRATQILTRWFEKNVAHPYPSDHIFELLRDHTKMSVKRIRKWFNNKRIRTKTCKSMQEIKRHRELRKKADTATLKQEEDDLLNEIARIDRNFAGLF